MLKEFASWFFTLAMATTTFLVGYIVLTDYFNAHPNIEEHINEWQDLDYHSINEQPYAESVTILEFFDYECSYCKELIKNLNKIKQEYPEVVNIKPIPFPLSKSGGGGYQAAATAVCAGLNLDADDISDIHASVYEHQSKLNQWEAEKLVASIAPTNSKREILYNCLQNREYEVHLQKNFRLGHEINLTQVPALIINGELYIGALSERVLTNIIESHI